MPAHRRYDKRVKLYRAPKLLQLLCFCIVLSYFAPAMHELRIQRRKRYKILWQRRDRKRQRLLARKARIQKKMDICAAKIVQYEERIRVKEIQLRKHATAHAGVVSAWGAATPMTEAEMRAQSYSRRFINAYLETAKDKARLMARVKVQQAPAVQPAVITL